MQLRTVRQELRDRMQAAENFLSSPERNAVNVPAKKSSTFDAAVSPSDESPASLPFGVSTHSPLSCKDDQAVGAPVKFFVSGAQLAQITAKSPHQHEASSPASLAKFLASPNEQASRRPSSIQLAQLATSPSLQVQRPHYSGDAVPVPSPMRYGNTPLAHALRGYSDISGIEEMQAELIDCKYQLERRNQLLEELDRWVTEFDEVRKAFDTGKEAQHALRQELAESRSELAACRVELESVRQEKRNSVKEVRNCEELLKNAHQCIQESGTVEEDLKLELAETKKEQAVQLMNRERNTLPKDLRSEIDLKLQLMACREELEKCHAQLKERNNALEMLQKELESCMGQLSEAQQALILVKNESTTLKQTVVARESELMALSQGYGACAPSVVPTAARVESVSVNALDEAAIEIVKLRRTVDVSQQTIGILQTQLDQANKEIKQSDSEKQVLARQLQLMQTANHQQAQKKHPWALDRDFAAISQELEHVKKQRADDLENLFRLQQERERELSNYADLQQDLCVCQEELQSEQEKAATFACSYRKGEDELVACMWSLQKVRVAVYGCVCVG